jgi:two-component sensor histidine kinase
MSDQFPAPAPRFDSLRPELDAVRRELEQSEMGRQAAQEQAALLRGELQHRVRNMLAIIRSIFSRTIAAGGSLEDVADHFRGRLDAIARYQTVLATDAGATIDFEHIVRDELQSFQFGDHPQIRIDGPPARLMQDSALLIGLALHELVTNSIKFGVLSSDDPRAQLDIGWTLAAGLLQLEWCETGIAVLSSAPLHRGFGREFIEQALPYQLGATTSFELRPGGVFCAVAVRLDVRTVPPGSQNA